MERIMRLPEVMAFVGLRRSTIYRLMQDGRFPPAVKLTTQTVGWRAGDIEEWIKARQVATEARKVRGLARQILSEV